MTPPAIPGWICEEAIGHGADATVWRARPATGGAALALKVIPLARLRDPAAHLREAWAAGSTGCRQVVAVHDAGQHGDCAWLAMELAHEDAAMLTARCGGRLRPATAARIARDVARGLQALTDHGFVHRDVKPSNILLRADGSAMIGDLAPLRGGGTATRSADLSGTPAYLSPEQIRGSAPDMRSDVHALGATIFALIAGRPPFTADGALDLLRAIAETPAPALTSLVPDVPPAIADVVATALAKDPVRRQQRPIQLANELDEALAGRTPSRAAAPAVRVAATPAEPHAWPTWLPAAAAAGVAVLIGLGVGALAARPSAQALADEALAAETAALALRERRHGEQEEAVIATLRQRLDRLRLERDRLTQRRPAAYAQAAAPAVSAPPAAAPAQAGIAQPAAPAAPAPSPAQPQSPPVVAAVHNPLAPAPVALPPARDPPAVNTEPAATLPRIHAIRTDRSLMGFSVNPRAVTHLVGWDGDRRLWSSTDHGASWTKLESPLTTSAYSYNSALPVRSAQWHGAYGFVPGVRTRIGWLTRDGGQTWQDVSPQASVISLDPASSPTQRALTADGTIHAAALVSGQGRVWRISATRDAGATWRDTVDAKADKLALHAAGDRLVMAVGSGGWQASLDLGRTWQDLPPGSHEKGVWSGDATTLRLLSWRSGMSLLDVASGAWSVAAMAQPEGGDLTAFAIDPRDPRIVFAIDPRSGLIRTTDQGRSWRPCVLPTIGLPTSLLIVGSRRPRLYCTARDGIASIDLTASCDDLFPATPAVADGLVRQTAPAERFGGAFACEPTRDGTVYAWYGSSAWSSRDGAASWQTLDSKGMAYANNYTRLAATPERRLVVLQPGTGNGIGYLLRADGGPGSRLEMPEGSRWVAGPAMRADGHLLAAVRRKDASGLTIIDSADAGQTWHDAGMLQTDAVMLIPVAGEVAFVHVAEREAVAVLGGEPVRAGATAPADSLVRTWFSAGDCIWLVDSRWSTLYCLDGRTRRWRTSPLGGLPAWADQVTWSAFAVDPDDPQRIWVVADGSGMMHSRDGGRTWSWLGIPFRADSAPSLGLLRGTAPRLLVSVPGGILSIDAGPAGSALFTRPLTAPP